MKKAEKQSAHFAVCLNNEGYKATLEVGKLYRFIPDKDATGEGWQSRMDGVLRECVARRSSW